VSDRAVPLWELVQTAHLATRRFTEVFAEAGLTPAQYGVLASLADGDDLSQADLARSVHVRPQSMGRLVAAMIEQGLVERGGPGGRGRRTGLEITPVGRAALDRARPAAYALNEPAALGVDADRLAALVETLTVIRARLADPDADPDAGSDHGDRRDGP
jgi:DNA-binding MarR family transcriptional regulator